MKPLRQSDLVHQLASRRLLEVDNDTGGTSASWVAGPTFWAEVIELDGHEALIEKVLQGVRHLRARTWAGLDLAVKDEILHAGVAYNVRSIGVPDGRRRETMILADTEAVLT